MTSGNFTSETWSFQARSRKNGSNKHSQAFSPRFGRSQSKHDSGRIYQRAKASNKPHAFFDLGKRKHQEHAYKKPDSQDQSSQNSIPLGSFDN